MLSSRAKWFVVIGIAIVLGALGVGGYYYISGKINIGASTSNPPQVILPTGNDAYATAGLASQKIIIKPGDGGEVSSVKIYPYIKSDTCNIQGATACFELSTTPLVATASIGAISGGQQVVTINNMPAYDAISAATLKEVYAATGYTLPYAPDSGGASTKVAKIVVTDSSGDYELPSSYLQIIKPAVASAQSKELESGKTMAFCDTSRNIDGNTLQCDAFISFSAVGFQSLTPVPSGSDGYVGGASGGTCSYYDNNAGKCLQAFVYTAKPGSYRIYNTDYSLTVTGEEDAGDTAPQILTFVADPTEVASGESSTLTWTTKNVNYCTLNGETVNETNGSTVVSPTETTPYGLACTNTSTSETVNMSVVVTVSSSGGGGGSTTACASGETAYSFTPNAWNLKTNNFTPKGSSTKLSDYFNSFLGTLVVNTYGYSGTGTSYTQNPNLSSVPAGVGYWFTSGVQNPICISADNVSANSATTVTIPSSIAMVGNPTAKAKKMSDIKFTYNGETMSLLDASNKSTPLVKAIFTYTAGADSYDAYYAKAYSNYVGDGAQFIENAMSKSLAPGSGFWIILNSKISGATLTF